MARPEIDADSFVTPESLAQEAIEANTKSIIKKTLIVAGAVVTGSLVLGYLNKRRISLIPASDTTIVVDANNG